MARIGFLARSKRFWPTQDFQEAKGIRRQIIAYIDNTTLAAEPGAVTTSTFYPGEVATIEEDSNIAIESYLNPVGQQAI